MGTDPKNPQRWLLGGGAPPRPLQRFASPTQPPTHGGCGARGGRRAGGAGWPVPAPRARAGGAGRAHGRTPQPPDPRAGCEGRGPSGARGRWVSGGTVSCQSRQSRHLKRPRPNAWRPTICRVIPWDSTPASQATGSSRRESGRLAPASPTWHCGGEGLQIRSWPLRVPETTPSASSCRHALALCTFHVVCAGRYLRDTGIYSFQ